MVNPRVLRAMAHPLLGHLDPCFIEVMNETQDMLRQVFQTENHLTVPISGTGSAGMEAMVCNLVEPGDPVLVCINGYFGGRIADMAARYGAEVHTLERPWAEVFTADEVEEALNENPARLVFIVHAETSTGAMQPLEDISKVVHAHDALLCVDCVTSLGGAPVKIDEWELDAAFSGTQKALSCPPGLAPLTFGERAVDKLHSRQSKVANWYLDLSMLESYWGEERTYHHTAPISMNFALREALRLILEEGLAARFERHRQNVALLWKGLEDLGFEMIVQEEYRLPTLTTVAVPNGVDEAAVRSSLLSQYNIEIAGGLGKFKGKAWRVGLMGYSSTRENVTVLLGALNNIVNT
jgi:alanine-glyoxylate transaminase/serine-glyoxylate transaminase/serine-pyruvate transaminase